MFYLLSSSSANTLEEFVRQCRGEPASCGKFIEWLHSDSAVEESTVPFYGMRLPSGFELTGHKADIEAYRSMSKAYEDYRGVLLPGRQLRAKHNIVSRAYARVGICGNPSDGFFGKTLGMTIENFWCEITLEASERLRLIPNPLFDPSDFGSLSDLAQIGKREGYYGGLRLILATCKKFSEWCLNNGIALPKRNFACSYSTNIPRQVGLAGSSAIVTALTKALLQWYGLVIGDDIALDNLPSFVLSVETEELGINAGLQDRVCQCFEGAIMMDFAEKFMKDHGYGQYTTLHKTATTFLQSLPFWLAFESDPSDSGKIHSKVRERFLEGDETVIKAMKTFAGFTDAAYAAIEACDADGLMKAMDSNFDLRRTLYGDDCIGRKNLEMVEIGRSLGSATKFPGSGGAIVGLAKDEDDFPKLRNAFESCNFVFCEIVPHIP